MNKIFLLLVAMVLCLCLIGCAAAPAPAATPEATCGHEAYLPLIDALEKGDYETSHAIIRELTGQGSQHTPTEGVHPDQETIPQAMEGTTPETIQDNLERIQLNAENLLDYFSLEESIVLRDPILCLQSLELKEEYARRLVDLQDIQVHISCYDTVAHGEIQKKSAAFLPSSYDMRTGELEIREIPINALGDGVISQIEYDAGKGCFQGYAMEITIHEASGQLILEE